MTEKRFTMYQNTIYDNGNVLSPFNCMKVMNTLHNENEQLKQKMEKVYNSLIDENEQLKSEIKDLNDVLARYEEKELQMND